MICTVLLSQKILRCPLKNDSQQYVSLINSPALKNLQAEVYTT